MLGKDLKWDLEIKFNPYFGKVDHQNNSMELSVGLKDNLLFVDELKNAAWEGIGEEEREDYFEIYWLREELSRTLLERHKVAEKGNMMYLVSPFRRPTFDFRERKGYFFIFHRNLLDYEVREFSLDVFKFFGGRGEFSSLFVPEKEIATVEGLTQLLLKESRLESAGFLFLRTLLKSLLLKLFALKEQKYTTPDLDEKRIYHFLLLVEEHYLTERRTGFYAEELNISPKRLNQILKKKLHKTIRQILHERIIMEAKHEMFISEKNIQEVAIGLGFSDKSYFSRFFKKMTGKTPEGYKNEVKQRLLR